MRLHPADHPQPGQTLEEHLRHVDGAADEVRTEPPLSVGCGLLGSVHPSGLNEGDCVLFGSQAIGRKGSVGVTVLIKVIIQEKHNGAMSFPAPPRLGRTCAGPVLPAESSGEGLSPVGYLLKQEL